MPDPTDGTTVRSDTASFATDTLTNVEVAERLVPGTLVAGRYRVVAFRGFGGMGSVYKARDEELGVDVALKVLRSDLRHDLQGVQRLRRELVLARQVTHRNVVRIHDIGESDGLRFLTMDFVDGPSLAEALDRDGPLAVERAVGILRQLSDALQQAHDAGVVHRDLKPSNILLGPGDTAYITDFGVARSRDGDTLTRAGTVVGTPDYLSPEQLSGEPVDGRSDLYTLGIVFYEMLTATRPFHGETQAEMLAQRLTGQVPEVSRAGVRVAAGVQRVIRKCLTRQVTRRYQQARELAMDLAAVEDVADGARCGCAESWPRGTRVAIAACGGVLLGAMAWWGWSVLGGWSAPTSAASAVAIRHAVAVLPLADETGDPSLAWVSMGCAELLATSLATSPDLRVVGRDRLRHAMNGLGLTPGRYNQSALRELGALLGVDRVITGSVHRTGPRMRVDLQLASAPLLSVEAEDAGSFFRVVNEMGQRVRRELDASPRPGGDAPALRTERPQAARAYLEGQARLLDGDAAGAAPLFRRAVEIDPQFVEALERLSKAYQDLGHQESALDAAERAVAIAGSREGRVATRARARLAMLRGDPAEAAAHYARHVARYPNQTGALIDLGDAQAAAGRLTEAAATFGRVTRADPRDPRAWLLLGQNSLLSRNPRTAMARYLLRARALYERLGDEQGMADVAEATGTAYYQVGDYRKAVSAYTDAIARRQRLDNQPVGDQRTVATTLRNRARAHLATGANREAAADVATARAIVQRLGDRAALADFIDEIGAMYEQRAAHGQAIQAYQEALLMRRGLGDTRRLAQSYDRVGDAAFAQGDYDGTPLYWNEALALRQGAQDRRGVILSMQDLGSLAQAQGRWSEAIRAFRDALERSRAMRFTSGMAASHGHLARLHHYQGRYGDALASFHEALTIARQLDEPRMLTELRLDEAALWLELGQVNRGRARLDEAAGWLETAPNYDLEAEHAMLLALLHEQRGERAAADRALEDARREADAGDSRALSLRVRLTEARIRSQRGSPQARSTLDQLARQADSLGNALLRLEVGEALASAELQARRVAAAERHARRTIALADRVAWHAGRHRLHALLAQALAARGARAAAKSEYAIAQAALAQVRAGLVPDLRERFDALPVVREIETGTPGT
ncbi:MAG: protein kinase [Luteitalea sp.]|nr:protein kinase [Luteitalea sp.]